MNKPKKIRLEIHLFDDPEGSGEGKAITVLQTYLSPNNEVTKLELDGDVLRWTEKKSGNYLNSTVKLNR